MNLYDSGKSAMSYLLCNTLDRATIDIGGGELRGKGRQDVPTLLGGYKDYAGHMS
jgi:hypothetical protein